MLKKILPMLGLILISSCDDGSVSVNPPNPPDPPVLASLVSGDGFITVKWDAVSSNNIEYQLYYVRDTVIGGLNSLKYPSYSNVQSPYKVVGLINKKQYLFGIKAKNSDGTSQMSNVLVGTPMRDEYAWLHGLWKAEMLSGGKAGKFIILFNSTDSTFSFSQVMDSTGVVSKQASGKYYIQLSTGVESNVVKLSTTTNIGYYQYNYAKSAAGIEGRWFQWVSGYDYMNASNPATTMWKFYK